MNDFGQTPGPAAGFRAPPPDVPLEAEVASGDGLEAHELVKADAVLHLFPSERLIGWLLFAVALVVFGASLSWAPFPGLPAQTLLLHLGLYDVPAALDLAWGHLVRWLARLPGLPVSAWAGLFSALCGAASVGLTARLMMRVGYLVQEEPGLDSFVREAQARRISGLVSGLFLLCCIPFWMVSTRSLPGAFHVLLLLVAVWLFSEYQQGGKPGQLGALGLIYGFGLTEFATFIVFLPLAVFLVAREMFRWQMLRAWKSHGALWGGLLLGLAVYPFNAWNLVRQGVDNGLFSSFAQAGIRILQEQSMLILRLPNQYPGVFLYIMCFSLVAWLLLFTMSHRSPWFYESGQVLVRLLFVAGLLGALYNASFAPWRLLGMGYLLVTPYVLMAICTGYMAGEFWILGEPQPLVDAVYARRFTRWARHAATGFALVLPVIVMVGGFRNWRVVDGRHSGLAASAAAEILDRLDGRDILFTSGFLDESLLLEIRARQWPVQLISLPRTSSPRYLRNLASRFPEDRLQQPLLQEDFTSFVENLLLSETGPGRVGILDLPDFFRVYGHLVPDGYLYRLEPSADRVDWPALLESQRPFWERLNQMAARPVPEGNMIRWVQDQLRQLASKVANNLGVMQAENGHEMQALEAFRAARRIYPVNLSALLNLLELGRSRELPEAGELGREWEAVPATLGGERWALSIRYGYVWRAREWVRRGWVWALSGAPVAAEAARRHLSASDAESEQRARLLDQAYLRWGIRTPEENYYCSLLIENEKNTAALLELGRLALGRNDPEAAEAYLAEALAMGWPAENVLFDRAMIAYVRGDRDSALDSLRALTRLTPGDARVWMALALLTEEHDPVNAQAVRQVKERRTLGISARLSLAHLHLSRRQWAEARSELEQALQLDSRNAQAWEMLVTLAEETGNPSLRQAGMNALLARNPEHFLRYQNEGVDLFMKGNLAAAEAAFRTGLARSRAPVLLNNLATTILVRQGDLPEALALVDEALQRQPGHAGYLTTRGEICLEMQRYDDARIALQAALRQRGPVPGLLLLLALSYEGVGDHTRAATVANALAKQPGNLSAQQQGQLEALRTRLR